MEQLVEYADAAAKRNDMHKDHIPNHKKHGSHACTPKVEVVKVFKYLGSKVVTTEKCENDESTPGSTKFIKAFAMPNPCGDPLDFTSILKSGS